MSITVENNEEAFIKAYPEQCVSKVLVLYISVRSSIVEHMHVFWNHLVAEQSTILHFRPSVNSLVSHEIDTVQVNWLDSSGRIFQKEKILSVGSIPNCSEDVLECLQSRGMWPKSS